jgi:hypothetical protein
LVLNNERGLRGRALRVSQKREEGMGGCGLGGAGVEVLWEVTRSINKWCE